MQQILDRIQSLHEGTQNHDTNKNSGFSLIELVVAVSIMLILAVVGFIAYQGLTDNAREAAVETVADQVLTSAVAAHNVPDDSPVSAVRDYNTHAEEIVANITTATAEKLEITAEDSVGTIAVASIDGNFSNLDTTEHSAAGVTYSWTGTPHNSESIKSYRGKEVARNYIKNPRFVNDAHGWNPDIRGRDSDTTDMTFDIVSSDGLFTSQDFGSAVGDHVVRIQRVIPVPEDLATSILIRLDERINVSNHSHIGYAVPIQGNGKTWMYFRDSDNRQSKLYPTQPQNDNVDGDWIIASGEIPEGAVYADPYFGTFLNDVYFGSPIVVLGDSQDDVDTQLEEYFDGDSA